MKDGSLDAMRSTLLAVVLGSGLALGCSKKNDPPKPAPSAAPPVASAAPSASSSPPADAAREEAPLHYTRKIEPADLEGRSLKDLALIRNTVFARAGKRFRKPWLHEHFSRQPWYQPKDVVDETRITALDRENANAVADYESALGRPELQRRVAAVRARLDGGTKTPDDELELHLLSSRLGRWQGPAAAEATSPLEDPASLDRLLAVKELDALSPRDLRLLRNMIYARRGRPFKSPLLDAYFSAMDWYQPDPAYTDKRLSAVDQKNIGIVRSVEDSLGGPINDAQQQQAEGWFGGA